MVSHCIRFRIQACGKLSLVFFSGALAVQLRSSESNKCWHKQLFQIEINLPVIVHADEINVSNSTLTCGSV